MIEDGVCYWLDWETEERDWRQWEVTPGEGDPPGVWSGAAGGGHQSPEDWCRWGETQVWTTHTGDETESQEWRGRFLDQPQLAELV